MNDIVLNMNPKKNSKKIGRGLQIILKDLKENKELIASDLDQLEEQLTPNSDSKV